MSKIRCPGCRGSKRVPKLGGIVGDCNTCVGTGHISAADKPVFVKVEPETVVTTDIIDSVAECVASSTVQDDTTKIDAKRVLYKRKRA